EIGAVAHHMADLDGGRGESVGGAESLFEGGHAGVLSCPPMKIGFIGLGAMGYPMARHLAQEHEVIVWNRTRQKAERHAREHGTTPAGDIADCAAGEVI